MAGERTPGSPTGADTRVAQSPVPTDFEQAVARVEAVMDLAQTHLVDRFPNITGMSLTDPEDGRHWNIDLSRRNAAGKLSSIRLFTHDADHPELFQIGSRMLARSSAVPMIMTDHKIGGRVASDKETPLQTAELAEARLRSVLGTQEKSEAEEESAFDRFVREVEEEADAGPTGEARRQLDQARAYYRYEAEKILARRKAEDTSNRQTATEEAWGFPAGTGEAAGLMREMANMEEEDDDLDQ